MFFVFGLYKKIEGRIRSSKRRLSGISRELLIGLFLLLPACETSSPADFVKAPVPALKPTLVQQSDMSEEVKEETRPATHVLGVIGEVEPVYFLPMEHPLLARIDTGAENSSVDAQNMRFFEREGEKWVAFDLISREAGISSHFEKKIYRQTVIKRQNEPEERVVVLMTIQIGSERITEQFSLADRSHFEYPALIGRNILKGRAVVDTALSKTLY